MIVYAVYIILPDGVPIYTQTFQTKEGVSNSILLSALLTALQSFAFEVTNSAYVFINESDFFGTSVSFVDCRNSRVEDCNFSYASYSKRMLNSIDEIDHKQMVMTKKISGDEYLTMEPTAASLKLFLITWTTSMMKLPWESH